MIVSLKRRHASKRFGLSPLGLLPNEEAIAPTYMKLAWRAQNTFDEAHALPRSTYDMYVSELGKTEKEHAIRNVLRYYQESRYAITSRQLDHRRLDSLPYAKAFRERFPLFNATIWAYHYLQVAVYDPLAAAPDVPSKQKASSPFSTAIITFSNTRQLNGRSC